jgi:cytochrome c553
MKRLLILAATISGVLAAASALTAPSVEAGAAKAATCQACHGASGNSTNPEWPSLAGLGADYIAEQLNNFKTGKRASPVMMPMTANLTPDDMADLGLYFDSLPNTGLEADPLSGKPVRGFIAAAIKLAEFRRAWPVMGRRVAAMSRRNSPPCAGNSRATW